MNFKIPYKIGAVYIYPNDEDKKEFKLKKVKGDKFLFECGHWCFGSVFMDLMNVETGKMGFELIPNYTQFKIEL